MEMYVVVDLEGRIARSRWTGIGTVYGDIKEAQAEAKIRNKKRAMSSVTSGTIPNFWR